MLLLFIFGCVFIACAVVVIIFKIKGSCKDEPALANFLLGLSLSIGLFSLVGGINLTVDANKNYTYMMTEKAYIETNFNSEDILTSLDVSNRYFQYQFKLERMKESKNDGWIASMYYFYDLEELELDVKEK